MVCGCPQEDVLNVKNTPATKDITNQEQAPAPLIQTPPGTPKTLNAAHLPPAGNAPG